MLVGVAKISNSEPANHEDCFHRAKIKATEHGRRTLVPVAALLLHFRLGVFLVVMTGAGRTMALLLRYCHQLAMLQLEDCDLLAPAHGRRSEYLQFLL